MERKQSIWGIGPRMLLAAAGYALPAGLCSWLWPQTCRIPAVPYPVFLAAGARGAAAIYTEHLAIIHIIRKVLLRVQSYFDYVIIKHSISLGH